MDKITMYQLRLEGAEIHLQPTFQLTQEDETHPEKVGLVVEICWQLMMKTLTLVHKEKLNEFGYVYFLVMVAQDKTAKSPDKQVDTSINSSNLSRVVLPPIKLPTLSVGYLFEIFFSVLLVENKQLMSVKCMSYLKSALDGEPASLIQSLSLTEANFHSTWNILDREYNN
ncbi:hypothetical protein PR048_013832 [Dryococelus australis]|uniref:Uncharacterized protein n=1 Tax=Dryococelus australis TaxID=614101 RepID=A0ABQ9HTJ3_9NEOP|nr:hypothetical protein PR048_013832 [Dryococelus australis]